jgi:hypothetical protein
MEIEIIGRKTDEDRDSVIKTLDRIEGILLQYFAMKIKHVEDDNDGAMTVYEIKEA